MDLIAALPGETMADFERSLKTCLALDPESITVHSLSVKRSSKLHEKIVTGGAAYVQADVPEAGRMISTARGMLAKSGYHPYYLYRQKYMAGNLENVGYAKKGHACLYNIGNMEETANVLALGAGGISKWLFERERYIDRAPNLRNIDEYTRRVDEMVERKRALILGNGGEDA
jgi:oxygen-independent coproporphyrinogen-3 oxidase